MKQEFIIQSENKSYIDTEAGESKERLCFTIKKGLDCLLLDIKGDVEYNLIIKKSNVSKLIEWLIAKDFISINSNTINIIDI